MQEVVANDITVPFFTFDAEVSAFLLSSYCCCVCFSDSLESPLLWIRGDPELEYLAELNLLQPEHMWVCLNNCFRCSQC